MRFPLAVSVLAAALALSACQSMPYAAQPPAAAPAPLAAATPAPAPAALPNDNLNATLWMQQTVEYAAVTQTVYRAAEARLDQALKDRHWDALVPEEREKPAANLPPAVIVDVDETVLDNSPYQARLVRNGEEYNEATWADWVNERNARAIPGAVAFAKAAAARGITVIYISNRAVDLDQPTFENLKREGFPIKDASVFMGLGTVVPGCEQNGTEKDCRRRLASRSYRILLQVGDQLGDFVQVVSNTPDGRVALFKQYQGWFGQRWFMLPNPTYGSWEPAIFNNDWSQPADVRRKAKQDALKIDY
ncbi:MAG: 5'-nucleotidase, lipoprotein e(P4) family [Thermomonas haemolytica]